jgi:hypothetical protein
MTDCAPQPAQPNTSHSTTPPILILAIIVPSSFPIGLLVSVLTPVRSLLQPFLSDADAAQLMRVSPSFSAALLTGFTFHRQFQPTEPTPAALGRLTALYDRYRMRVTRLMLPAEYNSTLLDKSTGQSLLPSSLVDLQVGWVQGPDVGDDSVHRCDLIKEDDAAKQSIEQRVELYRRRMMATSFVDLESTVSRMDEPIPPGALPPTLERLQLGSLYDHPLHAGVLPSSLTHLVLGICFNQPLLVGQLPLSLTHLAFSETFNQPLLPGVLPPSLLELDLGWSFNQPLEPGSLPAGLRRLTMGKSYNHPIPPGVLPPSLTHLHFSERYNRPLQVGSLPSGLVQLYFGEEYSHPLTAGVLPSTLRELHFNSTSFRGPGVILPGQLPDGLESLVLPHTYQHQVGVRVLPDGLLVLDLGVNHFSTAFKQGREVLVDGVLPRGLRWLKMTRNDDDRVRHMLPPTVQCCWHE